MEHISLKTYVTFKAIQNHPILSEIIVPKMKDFSALDIA